MISILIHSQLNNFYVLEKVFFSNFLIKNCKIDVRTDLRQSAWKFESKIRRIRYHLYRCKLKMFS